MNSQTIRKSVKFTGVFDTYIVVRLVPHADLDTSSANKHIPRLKPSCLYFAVCILRESLAHFGRLSN